MILSLKQKQKTTSRDLLIASLSKKLNENNPSTYNNIYQMACDTSANAELYNTADDPFLEQNIIQNQNEKKLNDYNKDNSRKAYMRLLNEVINNADLILEVLDIRDPLNCRSIGLESLITSKNKKLIIVLNKMDLVPLDNALKWKQFLSKEHATILFKANTQNQCSNLSQSSLFNKAILQQKDYVNNVLQSNQSIGSEDLLNLIKNYSREDNVKKKITVGIIGYPNVGKSSLINSLKRGKVAGVSNTPGFTKGLQEIILDSDVKLIDCPGVVFSKNDDNILHNVIRTEDIKNPIEVFGKIVEKVGIEYITNIYQLDISLLKGSEITNDRILYLLGEKTKKYKKGGIIDLDKTSRLIINDWNEGKLKYYSEPPDIDKDEYINWIRTQKENKMDIE